MGLEEFSTISLACVTALHPSTQCLSRATECVANERPDTDRPCPSWATECVANERPDHRPQPAQRLGQPTRQISLQPDACSPKHQKGPPDVVYQFKSRCGFRPATRRSPCRTTVTASTHGNSWISSIGPSDRISDSTDQGPPQAGLFFCRSALWVSKLIVRVSKVMARRSAMVQKNANIISNLRGCRRKSNHRAEHSYAPLAPGCQGGISVLKRAVVRAHSCQKKSPLPAIILSNILKNN